MQARNKWLNLNKYISLSKSSWKMALAQKCTYTESWHNGTICLILSNVDMQPPIVHLACLCTKMIYKYDICLILPNLYHKFCDKYCSFFYTQWSTKIKFVSNTCAKPTTNIANFLICCWCEYMCSRKNTLKSVTYILVILQSI